MRLIGLMVVRNEAWCLRATLPVLSKWLDGLVILNHMSHDDTARVIIDLCDPLTTEVRSIGVPDWNEATFRAHALRIGRQAGGTHFAVVDADEMLTANWVACIRGEAQALLPGQCLRLPWLQCWRSINHYRCDDSPFGTARVPVVFRDVEYLNYDMKKDGYQLHLRFPNGLAYVDEGQRDQGGVLHFQHAVWSRVVAKQALYQMQEVLQWPGRRPAEEIAAQYSGTVDETGLVRRAIPAEFWPQGHGEFDLNAEPWQLAQVRRLLEVHGPERFAGLNLFGLGKMVPVNA